MGCGVAGDSLISAGTSAGSADAMTDSGTLVRWSRFREKAGGGWAITPRSIEQQGWASLSYGHAPDPIAVLRPCRCCGGDERATGARTWVILAPLRSPAAVVRESSALQMLPGGRFELGIGSGRPDAERDAARLGVQWGSGQQRIDQAALVIAAVREQVRRADVGHSARTPSDPGY